MNAGYEAQCKCGWKSEPLAAEKSAEIVADQHETQRIGRRAYQHETQVVEVPR